jgi:hypothetical protein
MVLRTTRGEQEEAVFRSVIIPCTDTLVHVLLLQTCRRVDCLEEVDGDELHEPETGASAAVQLEVTNTATAIS